MKKIFKHIIVAIITFEAKLVLKKYKPKIVAITGSVGKTSTKDAVYTVLKNNFYTRKSEKSFNSEIGIPLTVLGCENGWSNPFVWFANILDGLALVMLPNVYPDVLVLEVGADRPGDIKKASKWISPDVTVFTHIGKTPVHVEFFSSIEELVTEKSYIVTSLKENGVLMYTEDDPKVVEIAKRTKKEQYSFGFLGGADFKASHEEIFYINDKPAGMKFRIDYDGNSVPITINGAIGKQHIYPFLAASGVARVFNVNLIEISDSIREYETAPGRMRIIDGIKNSTIIDDSYNASPIAVKQAIETLKNIKDREGQKKIVVVGDMMELGKYTVEEHLEVGKLASEFADVIVTVGVRARKIAEGALHNGFSEKKIYQFDDSQTAGKFLEGIVDPDDVVLIKGSQSPRMEKAVLEIMQEPQNAEKLLVRQETEWQSR